MQTRRSFGERVSAFFAGLFGVNRLMPGSDATAGPHLLVNGVPIAWPDQGLKIEVYPRADGQPYGPVAVILHGETPAGPVRIHAATPGHPAIEHYTKSADDATHGAEFIVQTNVSETPAYGFAVIGAKDQDGLAVEIMAGDTE